MKRGACICKRESQLHSFKHVQRGLQMPVALITVAPPARTTRLPHLRRLSPGQLPGPFNACARTALTAQLADQPGRLSERRFDAYYSGSPSL